MCQSHTVLGLIYGVDFRRFRRFARALFWLKMISDKRQPKPNTLIMFCETLFRPIEESIFKH